MLKNVTFNKKEKSTTQSTYQVKNIFIEKNEELTEKIFEVKTFLNSKVFKTDKMFNKLYSKSGFYYLIAWKDYEKKTWKLVSVIKYLRNIFRVFHKTNSNKFNVINIKKRFIVVKIEIVTINKLTKK